MTQRFTKRYNGVFNYQIGQTCNTISGATFFAAIMPCWPAKNLSHNSNSTNRIIFHYKFSYLLLPYYL